MDAINVYHEVEKLTSRIPCRQLPQPGPGMGAVGRDRVGDLSKSGSKISYLIALNFYILEDDNKTIRKKNGWVYSD